ncbi:MAG: NADH-quinone oxidoreductase subunit NuoE [Anaerolineae bacterium]|jgi:NADH-quinone oxidoreductase subunit E|nr:NADH-quinone oxidoreductase subunit NuoE [Anaerolineae bacterium]MDH7472545.1 NADH-quinone oxidoreductase subunit NuoE [Anaerolineae bacterium]
MPEKPSRFRDPTKQSMLLTALYIAQEQYGYLSEEAMERTAARLGLTLKDVYSTASFYTMFRTQPLGKYVIQVCEGLSCFLVGGAERLVDYISRKLNIQPGQTTPDGLFTLQTVQCLASCGTSPTLKVNDELYEDMTPDKVDRLLDQLAGR